MTPAAASSVPSTLNSSSIGLSESNVPGGATTLIVTARLRKVKSAVGSCSVVTPAMLTVAAAGTVTVAVTGSSADGAAPVVTLPPAGRTSHEESSGWSCMKLPGMGPDDA